ncbi:hypothetical protein Zm00014a_035370 [Zea mays]|uniref:non-specific serine/threonine protein kinase n=1 Tax=Zea mays TaxID=4577 RepID=A0A3L6ERV5_MAIZE|nr:Calcium-dependent protein kinase 10 [Zea mays]PWZ22811.1 hypothetical protein Zm00014a_035370 [Zea mays]
MGNTCVGPSITMNGFFQSVSTALWKTPQEGDALPAAANGPGGASPGRSQSALPKPASDVHHVAVQSEAPEPVKIAAYHSEPAPAVRSEAPEPVKIAASHSEPAPMAAKPGGAAANASPSPSPRPRPQVKRVSSAGLLLGSVLRRKTENLKDKYSLGRRLGQGQFGTTHLCVERATGKELACKSILKRKLGSDDDVEDVRREIQIMHHLAGHPSVVGIRGAYEDAVAVHLVMELCGGGELFDRIVRRGHYTERKAAELARVIVGVVEACHSMGVMHRDLKPENFLFADHSEEAALKTIDFGLSIFFRPELELEFRILVAAALVIAENLSEDEIAGLREMFKMIDADNSGQITFEELKVGLEKVGANLQESEIYALMQAVSAPHLVPVLVTGTVTASAEGKLAVAAFVRGAQADVDNNGTIDYGEFIAATLHLNKVEREDHLFAAFQYFDKDGSGYITADELQVACEEFGLGDVQLEDLIGEVDQDNDGRIDYNEFVAMMQKPTVGVLPKKADLQNSFSIGFREALRMA